MRTHLHTTRIVVRMEHLRTIHNRKITALHSTASKTVVAKTDCNSVRSTVDNLYTLILSCWRTAGNKSYLFVETRMPTQFKHVKCANLRPLGVRSLAIASRARQF